MREQAPSIQYTIRGIPAEVDRELRRRAAQRNESLNQLIVEELTMSTVGRRQKENFMDLVGKWTPDPEFDRVIEAQRRIDPGKWK